MDDLTLLRELGAERADEDPRARAAAWRALEARFEVEIAAGGEPASADGTRPSAAEAYAAETWRTRRSRRRGILALGGIAAAACAVAAILLLGSSSTAPPAAAAVLHQTAAVAAASNKPAPVPGPGQFLYTKTKVAELQGWLPGGPADQGLASKQRGAFNAVLPILNEDWVGPDGSGRSRETVGTPRFTQPGERARWKKEGSRLPQRFDPQGQRELAAELSGGGPVLKAHRGVYDVAIPKQKNFKAAITDGTPSLKGLPTHPEALRRAVEHNQAPGLEPVPTADKGHLDREETISGLFVLLNNPNATPALRAAAFNALAELPGIELRTDATDLAGRKGDAITYDERKSGTREEYIFDPDTSQVLGINYVLVDPSKMAPDKALPAGTVLRDTAFLEGRVVDSTHRPSGTQIARGE